MNLALVAASYNLLLGVTAIRRARRDPTSGRVSSAPFGVFLIPVVAIAGWLSDDDRWVFNVLLCCAVTVAGHLAHAALAYWAEVGRSP